MWTWSCCWSPWKQKLCSPLLLLFFAPSPIFPSFLSLYPLAHFPLLPVLYFLFLIFYLACDFLNCLNFIPLCLASLVAFHSSRGDEEVNARLCSFRETRTPTSTHNHIRNATTSPLFPTPMPPRGESGSERGAGDVRCSLESAVFLSMTLRPHLSIRPLFFGVCACN